MTAAVTRKVGGTLQKLAEGAAGGEKGAKWSHVLQYLDSRCKDETTRDDCKLPFESPFPAYTVPSDELRNELWYDNVSGDSVLRQVLGTAPPRVIAALCHLGPEALAVQDEEGRLPLHCICMCEVTQDRDKAMTIVLQAHSAALIHRDHGGRTPLHYLFWYHAPCRTPDIVTLFCRKLPKTKFYSLKQRNSQQQQQSQDEILKKHPLPATPKPNPAGKVPHNASIIHDGIHGCLPLHYAIMNGARLDSVQLLLTIYPLSKHIADRYGRTALHWYLGAGSLEDNYLDVAGVCRKTSELEEPWWDHVIKMDVVRMLLSSRVARTADRTGRYPLHWAAAFLAHHYIKSPASLRGKALILPIVQLLLDHYIGQISSCDEKLQTPLMVLFDTVNHIQDRTWEDEGAGRPRAIEGWSLKEGGPAPLDLPMNLLEMLLDHPDMEASETHVAAMEDVTGRLPLHAALEVAASTALVEKLVHANPAGLIHTTEDYKIPFHCVFGRACTTPLQSVSTIKVLLSCFEAGRFGTLVDGRLALKMEDSFGSFPVHYACQNRACLEIIECMVQHYPKVTMLVNAEGDLPVQRLIDDELMAAVTSAALGQQDKATDRMRERLFVDREKMVVLLKPLLADHKSVCVADSRRGLLPLHIAVLFQAAPYPILLQMLELHPEGAGQFATDSSYTYSALDMHELAKPNWLGSEQDWHTIRELLFSFAPKLESHRHRQELLDRCVRIVIDELNGTVSHHLTVAREIARVNPDLVLSIAASETIEDTVLVKLQQGSPKRRSRKRKKKKREAGAAAPVAPAKSFGSFGRKQKDQSQSIYDEDDTGFQYDNQTLSSSSSEDEDSSYFSGSASSEEDWDTAADDTTDRDTLGETVGDSLTDGTRTTNHSRYLKTRTSSGDDDDETASYAESKSATVESRQSQHIVLPDLSDAPNEENVEIVFDRAKRKAVEAEKKEDEIEKERVQNARPIRPDIEIAKPPPVLAYSRPSYLSEVAMRLWTFFVLYCDPNNPNDTYVKQVSDIFEEVGYTIVDELVAIPLPPFATDYVTSGESTSGCFRDIASPKCRELIHKTCYFVGRYDFDLGHNILVHRSNNGASVTVEAYEWVFTTQETTSAVNTGVSEAEIWKTGVRPAEIGATFRSQKRNVWIEFTKDRAVYEKTTQCNAVFSESNSVGTGVKRLFSSYNAVDCETKSDRAYRADVNDARFGTVKLVPPNVCDDDEDVIALSDYPYALVYPSSIHGTLYQYVLRNGRPPIDNIRKIVGQIAMSLRSLHRKGLTHGYLCMTNVAWVNLDKGGTWIVNCHAEGSSESQGYLGAVTREGYAQFSTGSLPPEMFAKLSPPELKAYRKYWQTIKASYGIDAMEAAKPFVDSQTGETYVVKCYFDPGSNDTISLPSLPYELKTVEQSCDLWCLGQILFTLCAGRAVVPVGARGENLLLCGELCDWSEERMAAIIHEHIIDPLAQDLLFRLLSPYPQRHIDSVESILRHPFFAESSLSVEPNVRNIVERRTTETATHNRRMQGKYVAYSEERWLEERNVSVVCWDFDLLERVNLSPSEIVRRMTSKKVISFCPSSFMVLPYKLRQNEQSELRSPDEAAGLVETVGLALIALSKACFFASRLQKALKEKEKTNFKLAISDLLTFLDLPEETFNDLQSEMAELVSQHVEAFRDNPLSIATKLVQRKVADYAQCYESKKMYLYLVDEYNLVPVVAGRYPIEVPADRQDSVLQNSIMFSCLCSLYAGAVTKSLRGLGQLVGQGSGFVSSWEHASLGLEQVHKLDENKFVAELQILQAALTDMFSTRHQIGDDDLSALLGFLDGVDPKREFGDLRRVTLAGASVWTSTHGVREIEAIAEGTTFKEALARQRSRV